MSKVIKKSAYYETPDVFGREENDDSRTIGIIGRSGTGKTHFVVNELNKLAGKKRANGRPVYDAIYFMTESLDATPLSGLDDSLNVKLIRGYYPKIVQLLKMIQDKSRNAFRFLIILDDIVDEKQIRRGVFVKQITILRNSHISTCVLVQYAKMLTPSCRNSLHHIYVTKIKPEEYKYLIESTLGSHVREALGRRGGSNTELSYDFYDWVGSDIVHYIQRYDKLKLVQRDPLPEN